MGAETWLWHALPLVKQKPVDVNLFDPQERMFNGRGAHMPLLVFLGLPSETRRSVAAIKKRVAAAASRGWPQERIRYCQTSTSRAKSRSKENKVKACGGGANDEGKGKGKGKEDNTGGGWAWTRGRGGWNDGEQPSWWSRSGADG